VIIRNGTVYDGTGATRQADVAIRGDRIAGIGDFKSSKANTVIDAKGLAVAPGFINMLSWSTESLIQDGRSQSEIRQGVTTEIMGEGESIGPVNDRVREHLLRDQTDIMRHHMEYTGGISAVSRKVACRAMWRLSSVRRRFANT
jgi:N-acyl-D-amino-acid deacylase